KATAPLFVVAGLIAALCIRSRERERVDYGGVSTRSHSQLRQIGFACAAAVFTAALLYSSFFTHLSGLRDALATYTHAVTRFGSAAPPTGHEKPWWYYLRLFGWFHQGG